MRETGSKPTRAEENRERQDAMPTVGEILAAERRRQGKSLNDAVEGTKIRSRLLDALENGRFDELPNPAYVKGYIQSYARYLEIPVEPLLDEYRRESATYEYPGRRIDRYLDIPHETIVPERSQAHAIPRKVWVAAAAAGCTNPIPMLSKASETHLDYAPKSTGRTKQGDDKNY